MQSLKEFPNPWMKTRRFLPEATMSSLIPSSKSPGRLFSMAVMAPLPSAARSVPSTTATPYRIRLGSAGATI
jgi:hypothetical protein